ncbi:replication initiation protein [Halonatronum saccharophilum]|uniref:replication initiation protein n=1 Tax=Halonatronum saccharophilum TaxID=150060 RepID=UPI00048238B5|nr:replication initiation protein [Halonatronum saccharophilum]
MKKELLNKPNQLIALKTKGKVTLIQRKIYNVFLKIAQNEVKFSNLEEIVEDKVYSFEVDCEIVHSMAGAKIKDLNYIEEELEDLMGIVATVRNEDNRIDWDKFSILPKIKKKDGKYKYMLLGNVVKSLRDQNYFTPLNLIMLKSLSSQYSVIFYELAIRYQKYKIPKMSIEKVREITNTEDDYERVYDFKKYVLDKACEEISEKTDIKLSYSTEKRGRRIAFIDFEIERKKEKIKSEVRVKKVDYSKEVLELFEILPKEEQVETHKRELKDLLDNHSFEYIKGDIEYAKGAKPDNFFGFLKASCDSGHYAAAKLEKKEKERELARKKAEEEKLKKQIKDNIEKKSKEKAVKMYNDLSKKELDKYDDEYDRMARFVPENIRPSREEYIVGSLQDEIREELEELLFN